MSGNDSIVWITVANLLYLASYSVHDILWLRILTVVAAGLLIPYYLMQPVPLMAAIWWNVVFIIINIYWIIRLMIERRPVHFTPDEAVLRDLAFASLTPREAAQLFAMGEWDDIPVGKSIVVHDNEQQQLSVILRGTADAMHAGITIEELGEGQFVGGIDKCVAEGYEIEVLVRTAVRVMCWPSEKLEPYLAKRPDVALALERSVGLGMRRLLDTALAEIGAKPKPQPHPAG
jgi:hypothetical protein